MIGEARSKAQLDAALGSFFKRFNQIMEEARAWKRFTTESASGDHPALVLGGETYGYSETEVGIIQNAVTHADNLRQVYEGTLTVEEELDHRQYMKFLWGAGF